MLIAITGTPGTGKTSVSKILEKKGYKVLDLNKLALEKEFITGKDEKRDSNIVDLDRLEKYFNDIKTERLVFIDSHLSHLISNVDKVIILRCNPRKLKTNLDKKNWKEDKIKENIEAEILDVILSEAVTFHNIEDICEIDTSDLDIEDVAEIIIIFTKNNFKNIKNYKIGNIDWSEEILKDF